MKGQAVSAKPMLTESNIDLHASSSDSFLTESQSTETSSVLNDTVTNDLRDRCCYCYIKENYIQYPPRSSVII